QIRLAGSPSGRLLVFLGSIMTDSLVVRRWLSNTRVTEAVRREAARMQMNSQVRFWLTSGEVPDRDAVNAPGADAETDAPSADAETDAAGADAETDAAGADAETDAAGADAVGADEVGDDR
ncbi:hypothetical protein JXA80_06940, partial [bacterium]|nr:hypothetical protein [candidate division CSSED10-310 bacterium]